MHWLQSVQKLLLRGQWYHFKKNARFRKIGILPKKTTQLQGVAQDVVRGGDGIVN